MTSIITPQLFAYNEEFQGFSTPVYPAIPASVTEVTMVFALIGAGGNSSGGTVPVNITPDQSPVATGGGGGVFIGSVVLPTNMQNAQGYYGTTLYAFVGRGGDQINSSTYISLKQTQTFPQPQTGEPWAENGMNGTYMVTPPGLGGNGGTGNQIPPIILIDSTGLVTYPITQIFTATGGNGQPGLIGAPGGAPGYQAISNWPFIQYPNTPTGQLQSAGNGGGITGSTVSQGDRGMVIVQFNFSGLNYSLYPAVNPMASTTPPINYFLGISDGQSADSTIVVPNMPLNADGTVPVTFVLQGSGGNTSPIYLAEACGPSDGHHAFTYGSAVEFGGSGGLLKGTVNLLPNTTIYVHVSAAGDSQGTYITLIAPPGGVGGPTPPTVTGFGTQTQASPYVSGGTNGLPGSVIPYVTQVEGYGGLYTLGDLIDSTNTVYPVTISLSANGNNAPKMGGCTINGPFPVIPTAYVPIQGLQGYLNTATTLTTIPTNGYGGGYISSQNSSGAGGIVMIRFIGDIQLTAGEDVPDPSRRIPCFPEGTRILTPLGYKPVETIQDGYLVTTSNHKQVPVKVYKRTVHSADSSTAPYFIPKYCLGSFPTADLRLSPHHAFRLHPDLWQIPEYAAKQNKQIRQYGIGKPVTYYHLECPNYFQDHLIVDGCIVESYGKNQVDPTVPTYVYQSGRKGFVRTARAKNTKNTKNTMNTMNNSHHRFSQ